MNFLVLSAGKEHAVEGVAVGAPDLVLLAFESLLEDDSCLVISPEQDVIAPEEATAAADGPVDRSLELSREHAQPLHVDFVLFRLRNKRRLIAQEKPLYIGSLILLFTLQIEFVEKLPKRYLLLPLEPRVLKTARHLNLIKGLLDPGQRSCRLPE